MFFHYRLIATKPTSVVGQCGWVPYMEFQENTLNRRRDTASKVLCSPSTVPFIIDWRWIVTKLTSFEGHGGWVLSVDIQKNPLNGRRTTANKEFCSSCKVPFIIDWWQQNLQLLWLQRLGATYVVSGKYLELKKRYSWKGTLFVPFTLVARLLATGQYIRKVMRLATLAQVFLISLCL
jgi:hypothetical protein